MTQNANENSNQKVLIVDDDPFIAQGLRALMEGQNVGVVVTNTADNLDSLLEENTFSLFLVDLRLSGVDGVEGLEVIKYCKEKQPEGKVILMTAYGSEEIKQKAFENGASEFLEKPIDIPSLVDLVRSYGIPVSLLKDKPPEEPTNGDAAQTAVKSIGKILVVEDSDLLQRMYTMIFKRYTSQGCELIQARNGKEGLEALARHPDVNIIVLDINMPVMNGLEFLGASARRESFSHIPVLVVSTEGKAQDTQTALEEGASDYITKPFKPQALLRIVEKLAQSGQ